MTVTSSQVTTLLETVLFESATAAKANATSWTAIANVNPSTSTVAGLASYMAGQPEATIAQQVVRYYQGALGRVPSTSEISFYVKYAETGLTASQIATGASAVPTATWNQISQFFANSPEFTTDFGLSGGLTAANEAIVVTGFYNNILGRNPSSSEIAFYTNALNNGGATPATLVQFFTNSPEYQAKANATIQSNLTSNGVAAVATVAAGGNPLTSTTPIGPLPAPASSTVALTTGLDTLAPTGTVTVTGILDNGGTDQTFSNLDSVDGSGGNVTLAITDLKATGTTFPTGVTLKNLTHLDWTTAAALTFDATAAANGISGLKEFDVLKSASIASLKVGSGTAVVANATGAAKVLAVDSAVTVTAGGAVTVDGGSNLAITTAGAVTVGKNGSTAVSGTVTVTDTELNAGTIQIDGGTTVSVTSSDTAAAGTIKIGATTAPTGAVTVVDTNSYKAALTGDAITVKGGTTVTITDNLAQAAANGTTLSTTAGAITVTGTKTTTTVSVTETAAVTAVSGVKAVTGVASSDVVTFSTLAAAATTKLGGLTFKNTSGSTMTAAQVAAAFANLTTGSQAGSSSLGTYSGTFTATYTGGAVVTSGGVSTVSFADNSTGGAAAIAATGSAADAHTAGTAAVKAVTGVGGIIDGAVTVNDGGTNTITSVTVNGFNGVTLGANKALTTLSLSNGAGALTVNNAAGGATTLGLTLNGDALAASTIDAGGAIYTSLNITTATADSTVPLTAAAVTALTVSGTKHVDLSSSVFTALKTVTVSGSAGVTIDVSALANVTDVNASATSGNNTVTIDATKATFEGGSGNDTVNLITAAPTKAISGGSGTDTINFDTAAHAVTASGSSAFAADVTGFEVLGVTAGTGTGTQIIHVDTLGGYSQITTGGEAASGNLDFDGVASGVTLTLTADAAGTGATLGGYTLSNTAWTSSAPAALVNIDLTKAGALAGGSVTAANVTAVNIVTSDTTTNVVAGTNTDTLTLVATKATTITASGNANLSLIVTGDTALTKIDGHALTGGLTVTAAGTVAETITGSSTAGNTLSAATGASTADVLIGGAGVDTLTANKGLDTLTGGGGNDVFVIVASTNVNSYATITDAHAGNVIEMTGATSFVSAKISLASTAVFQDYANTAVTGAAAHTASWFQYGGDTYIVENVGTETSFLNGSDLIVKLTGLHDLSTAGFNTGIAGVVLHS